MRITRLLAVAALGTVLGTLPVQGRASDGGTRSGSWTQTTFAHFSAGEALGTAIENRHDGEVVLPAGRTQGGFTSSVGSAEFPFNALAVSWEADVPDEAELTLFLRARARGGEWSRWVEAEELDARRGLPRQERTFSDLVFLSGDAFQFRAEFAGASAAATRLESVTITYIDSTPGPTASQAAAQARPAAGAGVMAAASAPSIIPRSGWGADEGYRYYQGVEIWPPDYQATEKLILHHTATGDGSDDPAALVRAIYYYHAVTLGWGDIGYNFLVDTFGNIYEGRYGGDSVTGAHTAGYNAGSNGIAVLGTYMSSTIPVPSRQALVDLLSWETSVHGIDPLGSGFFVDGDFPNIAGHRDFNTTDCPGDAFYADLPAIRQDVAATTPEYAVAWVSHDVPAALAAGINQQLTLVIRNTGTATWANSGSEAVQLGYRWYDAGGSQYLAEPLMEQYFPLSSPVAPGEEVTLHPVLKVPWTEGSFTLRWELLKGNGTWFNELSGSPQPLLLPSTLSYRDYVEEWDAHNTPQIMAPGQTTTVRVQLTNRGLDTWYNDADMDTRYRLGYHWFDESGNLLSEGPHSELPYAMDMGQSATVTALLVAPPSEGTYILRWDMVHEQNTWFAEQGNTPLGVLVVVVSTPYQRFLPVGASSP